MSVVKIALGKSILTGRPWLTIQPKTTFFLRSLETKQSQFFAKNNGTKVAIAKLTVGDNMKGGGIFFL